MSMVLGIVIMLLAMSIIDIVKHETDYFIVKISHLIGEIVIVLITIYYYTH